MSKYRELELLKEQELTLLQLHMSFNDQLNRLKVEELALTNLLRLQKEREMQAQTGAAEQVGPAEEAIEQETMEVLNLIVSENPTVEEDIEEEEEEEDEDDENEDDVKEIVKVEDGDNNSEEEDDEANNSYHETLTTYLQNLYDEQREQNQQEQLMLSPSQVEELEEEEEEDEET